MPTRPVPPEVNPLNNSNQTQSNPNNIQIELSSDSGEEAEIYRQPNSINRERRRRETNLCNKGNNSARPPVPTSEQVEDSQNNNNLSNRGASSQQHSNTM